MENVAKRPLPTPPTPPRKRVLKDVARSICYVPYMLAGDNEEDIFADGNFTVLCGPFQYRSYLNYENKYGRSIDADVQKILYVFFASFARTKAVERAIDEGREISELELAALPVLVDNPVTGCIETPYGPLVGSLEKNMVDIVAYILSQYGRVKSANGDGTYELYKEGITEDDILDNIEPGIVLKEDADGTSFFFEILKVSNVYDTDEVERRLKEKTGDTSDESEDDEPKNSRSNSVGVSHTNARKKISTGRKR